MGKTPLPKIGNPAVRALNNHGINCVEDLSNLSQKELINMHGVGPKAIRILKQTLAEQGRSLKE